MQCYGLCAICTAKVGCRCMWAPVNDISSIQFAIMSECTHIVQCCIFSRLCLNFCFFPFSRVYFSVWWWCLRFYRVTFAPRWWHTGTGHIVFSRWNTITTTDYSCWNCCCHCDHMCNLIAWFMKMNVSLLPDVINPMIMNWNSSSFRKLILAVIITVDLSLLQCESECRRLIDVCVCTHARAHTIKKTTRTLKTNNFLDSLEREKKIDLFQFTFNVFQCPLLVLYVPHCRVFLSENEKDF